MKSTRTTLAVVSALAVGGTLAACSSTGSPGSPETAGGSATAATLDPSTKVALNVVGLLPNAKPDAVQALKDEVAQFQKANPNITVTTHEYEWKATTFSSDLAGGTLPDVFEIPFTDGKGLIANKQIADLDPYVKALPYANDFNKDVLASGQGANGDIYAIPYQAYGIGLHYNRDLFTKAGLDPNKPPTTWDEVRAAAKQIADKTGVAGYMQMTNASTGGWQTSVATYSRGGRMEKTDGGKTTATVNNDQTKAALQYLHDLRWTDNSMGSNFLFDWTSLNQAFAAGQIGMYTSGNDVYTALVGTNNVDPTMYGLTMLPTSGPNSGVLTGGTMAAVSVNADNNKKAAAMKWIDFHYLQKLTNQAAAVRSAETTIANKQPVGVPALPIFSKAKYDESQSWVKPYINVPLQQMTGYTSKIFDATIIPEPPVATQDLYATLDPVVQAVLTNKNADINALLTAANTQAQRAIDSAS